MSRRVLLVCVCVSVVLLVACRRPRNHVQDAGSSAPAFSGSSASSGAPAEQDGDRLDSKPRPGDLPETYPPPEYVEKAPSPKRVESPNERDVPLAPATGSAEGYRFDAKTIAFESKPSGWTIAVFGRQLRDNQAFFPTRAPSFYLTTKATKISAGTVLSARLAHGTGLWFQTTNEKGSVQSFGARSSYFLKIEKWEAQPFDGKWKVAGRASGKILFYVEGHNCTSGRCFRGASVAGTFEDAPIRYFTAPP